ncbi:MAG: 3-phosphoshikimate 1-carboxyvinyltransferase, partial [Muribaculaceae bacterium]|nr:3-phosphoshikimate 1-carboxyvinyltransferase [Muribaculaceae bacterium]
MNPVINLPLSKSIALRVLTMNAVSSACGAGCAVIKCLPDAEDVAAMVEALDSRSTHIYIGEGGAPIRFYTALAASTPDKDVYLTGSERLMERPISILVGALRDCGAEIVCTERE